MKVRDVMTSDPTTCSPRESAAMALAHMWEDDCGIVPVVDDGRLVGIVTDRDLAMALLFEGARPTEIAIGTLPQNTIHTCSPEDDLLVALETMTEHRVRRLPVVEDGQLVGMVSLNDIALESRASHGDFERPSYGDVAKALRSICAHHKLPVTV